MTVASVPMAIGVLAATTRAASKANARASLIRADGKPPVVCPKFSSTMNPGQFRELPHETAFGVVGVTRRAEAKRRRPQALTPTRGSAPVRTT